MSCLRLSAGLLLAVLLLSTTEARAACTRDSDCTGGLICVRGQCATPVDPGSSVGPGTVGAADKRSGACVRKCDQGNSRCLSRVRGVAACVSAERNNCISVCQRNGSSAKVCATDCNSSQRRNAWEPGCAQAGDSGRQSCLTQHEKCLAGCHPS